MRNEQSWCENGIRDTEEEENRHENEPRSYWTTLNQIFQRVNVGEFGVHDEEGKNSRENGEPAHHDLLT
jgi:hypothetical protein